jgi:hypothetical protein
MPTPTGKASEYSPATAEHVPFRVTTRAQDCGATLYAAGSGRVIPQRDVFFVSEATSRDPLTPRRPLHTVHYLRTMKFVAVFFDRVHRYALGVEEETATAYLAIPVGNTLTDYDEFYALSEKEYTTFNADPGAARAFAQQCRHREHDDRLILKPGWDRGEPW